MNVNDLLTSTLKLKGNEASVLLAKELSFSKDKVSIKKLVVNLNNKDKKIQSDCIKTLYEIGYLNPELISDFHAEFIQLLKSKNNRLVWGGMIALATITDLRHKEIFDSLDKIMETINRGSVITIDNGVEILAKLNKHDNYFNTTDPLLADQLWKCPIKQLPQYIEKAQVSITKKNKKIFITIIEKRKSECQSDSQVKRLEKSLKRIEKV